MITAQHKLEPSRSLIQENKANEQKKIRLNFKLSNTAQQKQEDQFLKGKEVPEPNIISKEIAENLESALEQFTSIHEDLIVNDDLVHS